jgi:hypothetical protein
MQELIKLLPPDTAKAITNLMIAQGAFGVLFILLLAFVLFTSWKRENRLMSFVDKQGDRLESLNNTVTEIKKDVEDLKRR